MFDFIIKNDEVIGKLLSISSCLQINFTIASKLVLAKLQVQNNAEVSILPGNKFFFELIFFEIHLRRIMWQTVQNFLK